MNTPRPVMLGGPARPMAGMFHPPLAAATSPLAGTAVLLCPPWGQEAIRSHRAYRLLADRLSRTGAAVLRFDPHGCGDSPGDDDDGDLLRWQADVLVAHQALRGLAGDTREVCWLGLRLGATLLALAARSAPAGLRRLALWSPVIDGAGYLRALGASHRSLMLHVRGHNLRTGGDVALDDPPEAMGFVLTGMLRTQLRALNAEGMAESLAAARLPVGLLMPDALTDAGALLAALRGRNVDVRSERESEPVDWIGNEALGTAIAPATTIAALVAMAGGAR